MLKSTLSKSLAVVLSAASLLMFAACGTSDKTDSNSNASNGGAAKFDPSTVQKDDAIAAMLPDSVKAKGTLVNGVELTYAPAEFVDSDGKTPVGYDIDLTKALAAVFGLKPVIESASFDSIIPAIGTKYDVGISDFSVNEKRLESVNMVSYANGGMMYVVKKGNPNNIDINNLCGTKIAVQTGTVQEEYTNQASDACKASGKSGIDIQSFDEQTKAATAVVTGKADLFYSGSAVAAYAVQQNGDQLETIGTNQKTTPTGIAVAKNDMQMAQAVQKAVQKLMDDGTYKKIFDSWGDQSEMIPTAKLNDPNA